MDIESHESITISEKDGFTQDGLAHAGKHQLRHAHARLRKKHGEEVVARLAQARFTAQRDTRTYGIDHQCHVRCA